MHISTFFLIVSCFVNFVLGLLVLQRTYKKSFGWFFAFTAFSIVIWGIGDILILHAAEEALLDFGAKLFYFGPVSIPVTIWWFAIAFPENKPIPKIAFAAGAASIAVWLAIILFNLSFILDSISVNEVQNTISINRFGFLIYAAHFSVFFALTYIVLLVKLRKIKNRLFKLQALSTFCGVAIASLLAMVTNLSLPLLGTSNYVWLGPILTFIFVGFVAFAIVKHKLFDIRMVIARSLGYLLSIGFVAIVFGVLSISLVAVIFQDKNPISLGQQVLYTLFAVLVGFSFQSIRQRFDKLTNSIFYRDAYDPQTLLDEHNQIVVSENNIESLLVLSSKILADYLRAEFVIVGLRETAYSPIRMYGTKQLQVDEDDINAIRKITPHMGRQIIIADDLTDEFIRVKELMSKYGIALIARLATTEDYEIEGLGYLLIGHKKSGNPYTSQDTKILQIIANELVIAVQNALRFEEIEKFADTLQDKVETATAQLRKTNAKLKAMDETKDEFISMASHQLRTPLTSVKGYVSMVLEGDAGELNEMQSKLLNQAFISSQRMVYLISDLLNVSRLRTGKFVIESKPTNLADAVEGEINQLKEVAKGRNVTLTYNKPAEFTELPLDETKIRQVVMNFTDNAIYYTPSGGEIAVNVAETDDTIEFTVKDSGMGVPKSEQPHLFTKFYRAGNAKKARPDGTGLGLFMAKKVVIAQGGSIIFDSKEGKGSTFGFRFSKKVLLEKASQPKTVALPDPEQN